VFCSRKNKPSLNASQLAKITGLPATKAVKPVQTQQTASTTPVVIQPVKTVPKPQKKRLFGEALFKATPAKPQNVSPKIQSQTPAKVATVAPRRVRVQQPANVIRSQTPVIQGGTNYNIAATGASDARPVLQGGTGYNIKETTGGTSVRAKTSVRGFSFFSRRKNRNALRSGQDIHPADLIKAQRAAGMYPQSASSFAKKPAARAVDPIHQLVVYPVVIDADVTARGNAQMALVWSNTVPMKLVQKGRVQLASSDGYTR